ncbi:MAG: L-2-amino-thiazoline-4-carboxylic acid hydrolase [Alphaproteobacteria bacterium]|nr:L-2-amino-thiazoline-4-carboxylic acid hydrolase [Alphaproteobacteria bacterium]
MTDLPILEQRRIEATVIKPIYEEMVAELGTERAQQILGAAIRKAAIAQGAALAGESEGGLRGFISLFERWKAGDALEVEVLHESDQRFDFNITRCRYAEMYRQMGLGEIGHLLSCGRDGAFCDGYDPKIRLERTQTIMGGASHCDFRYTVTPDT